MASVSLLMAVYAGDKPEWFQMAIQSAVFEQTRPVNEVVLVIDGPLSPEFEEVIDRVRRLNNSIVVQLRVHSGLAAALNEGIKHCSSEYVARFDSDDICHPRRIELQMEYLERNKNIDVLGAQIREFDDNMNYCSGLRIVPCDHESILNFSKKRCPVNHMTVIYRKSAVDKVGGYPLLYLREDYGLWIKLLGYGYRFANLQDVLVYSRGGIPMLKRRGGKKYIIPEWDLHKYKISNNIYLKHFSYFIVFSRIVVALLPVNLRGFCYRFVRFREDHTIHPAGFSKTAFLPRKEQGEERVAGQLLKIPFHTRGRKGVNQGVVFPERGNQCYLQAQDKPVCYLGRDILPQDELQIVTTVLQGDVGGDDPSRNEPTDDK